MRAIAFAYRHVYKYIFNYETKISYCNFDDVLFNKHQFSTAFICSSGKHINDE